MLHAKPAQPAYVKAAFIPLPLAMEGIRMSKPTKRLGRGLSALVTDLQPQVTSATPTVPDQSARAGDVPGEPSSSNAEVRLLPTESLQPNPFQPRSSAVRENVASLAASIRENGLLQPITVRMEHGEYQIISGERRWWAARSLDMPNIPAIVRPATDRQMLELALIENIQREDLNAIDRARAYRRYCGEFGLKPEEVATRLGEDRSTVVNYLRLLDLPDNIRAMVEVGQITMGHARCLLGVADGERQRQLAEAIVANELSVRAVEEIVRRQREREGDKTPAEKTPEQTYSAQVHDLEQKFEQAVKTKVTIKPGRRKGAGRIVIEYYSLDDFDRIASSLGVELE
jgi:ParB family chromosome partitioning protein